MKIFCSYQKLVPIQDLKPHTRNRNRHPQTQIELLAKILKERGWRHPIIISNLSGVVVAGHGRLEAAKLAGFTEVPVDYQNFASKEQEYEFLVADNATALWAELDLSGINLDLADMGPDLNLDMLGIKDFTLDVTPDPQCDEDEVPEHVEPKAKLGDIYQLGRHRLMCGDSLNIQHLESLLDGVTVEALHTDPPYGLADKWTGGTWGADPMYAEAKKWDQPLDQRDIDWMLTLAPISIVWGGNYYKMPASRCWLAWTKTQRMETMADFELAWTSLDKVAKSWDGARNADGKRQHPTQKPVALIEWALSVHANPKTVLDLFGGSGSTLIACEKNGRSSYLMEISPKYCDEILARWEKYTGKTAELIPNV